MDIGCVIFDLDGTLVDSELLCQQAFIDLIPELSASGETAAGLLRRYRGRKLDGMLADLGERIGRMLPQDFEPRYRAQVARLFDRALQPVPGVPQMLEQVAQMGLASCVASSGPLAKIRHSMSLCGLAGFFGERVFSAYVVGAWKPDPGLFLHAADAMGFAPARCVVVEDSAVGVEAAVAAGMRVLQFAADPHDRQLVHPQATVFASMQVLPALLAAGARPGGHAR